MKRLQKAGVLENIMLIGSWCLYFYKDYFSGLNFTPTIRTRDIDFLVPLPPKIKNKVDIPELLKDLGFLLEFVSSKGYIRLDHPELIVGFLVPERGKGSDKPYPLPQLGLNAQPLRFLDFLVDNLIEIEIGKLKIRLPHPAAFALHKLIILGRRTKKEKADKDKEQALMIIDFIVRKEETTKLRSIYSSMPVKWQKKIVAALEKLDRKDVVAILQG
ncbi:MAG: GSU2403 family nucleotidyltransferase fold protein [bacterium]|nr:nucleotidyltransferase domain-containing protein [Candidatus Margulisiibacteriota bacterium]